MNTTENNKLIAEFMGYETYEHTDNVAIRLEEGNGLSTDYGHVHTKYHTSWDWLMPVVYKIKWLEDIEEEKTEDIDAGLTNALLEQTFEAVVEFIKFYNENKNYEI
jgi:hypothetical protein